jgi:hypothetical protein
MSEHLGILGALTPDDIADAFERARQREAQREQEYRDAIAEIESNVIYGVDFLNKKPKRETIGAL